MKRNHYLLLLLLTFFALSYPVSAQSKPKGSGKPKPIRATVTVKADPPIKPLPNETDESAWSEFESKEDSLTLLFPGRKDDVSDDAVGPVRTFDVATAKAHYMLAIRDVGPPIQEREIGTYLDETIQNAFPAEDAKSLEKKSITYEGRTARQISLIERDKRFIARVYYLNGKLFITSVSIKTKDYTPAFDKWIDKFFDSFRVKVRVADA